MEPALCERIRGCLLGGAVGDAIGEPIEFSSLSEIRRRFGPDGVTGYVNRPGRFTDDTQMTLFTVDGLVRFLHADDLDPVETTRLAYLRWLRTQGMGADVDDDGWLFAVEGLHRRMAPGNTCLTAMMSGGWGTTTNRINDSKGCGGVMRVAPAGFVPNSDVFVLGCDLAAITHGHPSGFLASGALSLIIAEVVEGSSLSGAVATALQRLPDDPESGEVISCLELAVRTAQDDEVSAEKVEAQGEGWVAEEALGIAVYCALVADDFAHGVLLAANHGGDSDSTASIAGQILGCQLGESVIPEEWIADLEMADVVGRAADELAADAETYRR